MWDDHGALTELFLSPIQHQYTQEDCMQRRTKRVFFLEWFAHVC